MSDCPECKELRDKMGFVPDCYCQVSEPWWRRFSLQAILDYSAIVIIINAVLSRLSIGYLESIGVSFSIAWILYYIVRGGK